VLFGNKKVPIGTYKFRTGNDDAGSVGGLLYFETVGFAMFVGV